jgi:hypothetical protein
LQLLVNHFLGQRASHPHQLDITNKQQQQRSNMEKVNEAEETELSPDLPPKTPDSGGLINASGHRQELDRNFRLINICGLGITTGNTWIALGGSIVCKFYLLLLGTYR